ncbi:MAG: hypothetical protein U9R25_06200 [Chloroflexota bacterium]|nr:hypothetical protein [Chloroflexota bacterium]
MQKAEKVLGPNVSQYLGKLTLGNYTQATVDGDLTIQVKDPDHPDGFAAPGQLSKGTQDQLYLAARLALVDLMFPDATPPIFLDDPFVKFDPDRRQAAVQLCQTIVQEHQVFLFTCSDDYDGMGKMILMPADRPES